MELLLGHYNVYTDASIMWWREGGKTITRMSARGQEALIRRNTTAALNVDLS